MTDVFDRTRLKLRSLREREHLLGLDAIVPLNAAPPALDSEGLDALKIVAQAMREAAGRGRAVIWCMGAHVIRRGLGPHIVDLARRGLVSHVATNGAGAIHDFEFALIGATTESVARYIQEGQFGLWDETGQGINTALKEAAREGWGAGQALGRMIAEDRLGFCFPHKDVSFLAGLHRAGVPATVHIAIGQDIIHEHPACDGAALGAASYTDFLYFATSMEQLGGGVFLNFGSQVMGPEVYLKALAMVRNVAHQRGEEIDGFVTVNCDLIALDDPLAVGDHHQAQYYYRPKKTLLVRSLGAHSRSFHVVGDHRATVLNLYSLLAEDGP